MNSYITDIRALCLFTHLILTLTFLGRYCYCLLFADEGTEAREFKVLAQIHTVSKWQTRARSHPVDFKL